ncbi:hypothetical protein CSUI_007802 [Cystoisospora suis]|uniref:Uncharacterized protein n=1 Tax=Cystoisospora suis TaxID=483139 RepID=A0A2C6KCB1_9APIC|nr:hypothetical protein CSUI_007802 [Cystoisospora suis]
MDSSSSPSIGGDTSSPSAPSILRRERRRVSTHSGDDQTGTRPSVEGETGSSGCVRFSPIISHSPPTLPGERRESSFRHHSSLRHSTPSSRDEYLPELSLAETDDGNGEGERGGGGREGEEAGNRENSQGGEDEKIEKVENARKTAAVKGYRNRARHIADEMDEIQVDLDSRLDTLSNTDIPSLLASTERIRTSFSRRSRRIFQALVPPQWTIEESDPLVKQMRNSREAAIEAGEIEDEGGLEPTIYWRGPGPEDVFGTRLIVRPKHPYKLLGVYTRRSWGTVVPSSFVREDEALRRQREGDASSIGRRPAQRSGDLLPPEILQSRKVAVGMVSPRGGGNGRSILTAASSSSSSSSSAHQTGRPSSKRRGLLRNGTNSRNSPRGGDTPSGREQSSSPTRSPRRPGGGKRGGGALLLPRQQADKDQPTATSPRGEAVSTQQPTRVRRARLIGYREETPPGPSSQCPTLGLDRTGGWRGIATPVTSGMQIPEKIGREMIRGCAENCLGMEPEESPFMLSVLQRDPPPGYGRAPIEDPNVRIPSNLEDFLYLSKVPIKRPTWDTRRTPLLSTQAPPAASSSSASSPHGGRTREGSLVGHDDHPGHREGTRLHGGDLLAHSRHRHSSGGLSDSKTESSFHMSSSSSHHLTTNSSSSHHHHDGGGRPAARGTSLEAGGGASASPSPSEACPSHSSRRMIETGLESRGGDEDGEGGFFPFVASRPMQWMKELGLLGRSSIFSHGEGGMRHHPDYEDYEDEGGEKRDEGRTTLGPHITGGDEETMTTIRDATHTHSHPSRGTLLGGSTRTSTSLLRQSLSHDFTHSHTNPTSERREKGDGDSCSTRRGSGSLTPSEDGEGRRQGEEEQLQQAISWAQKTIQDVTNLCKERIVQKVKQHVDIFKRDVNHCVFDQEDIRIFEYWHLKDSDTGKPVWTYEGLQWELPQHLKDELPMEGRAMTPEEVAAQEKARERPPLDPYVLLQLQNKMKGGGDNRIGGQSQVYTTTFMSRHSMGPMRPAMPGDLGKSSLLSNGDDANDRYTVFATPPSSSLNGGAGGKKKLTAKAKLKHVRAALGYTD